MSNADVARSGGNLGGGVGIVVGQNGGIIDNAHASGTSATNFDRAGGISGYSSGTISNSSFVGTVSGHNAIAGIVGYNSGTINTSYSFGDMHGEVTGGIVGYHYYGVVNNCYSGATIVGGTDRLGGLIGRTYYGETYNSYAYGSVTGIQELGGLLGNNFGGDWPVNSYYDKEVATCNGGACDDEARHGATTAELQSVSWLTTGENNWDFSSDQNWSDVCDGAGYPPLAWEGIVDTADCRN
jgi:hypothetical protein